MSNISMKLTRTKLPTSKKKYSSKENEIVKKIANPKTGFSNVT